LVKIEVIDVVIDFEDLDRPWVSRDSQPLA
jgi:hypothetical protein